MHPKIELCWNESQKWKEHLDISMDVKSQLIIYDTKLIRCYIRICIDSKMVTILKLFLNVFDWSHHQKMFMISMWKCTGCKERACDPTYLTILNAISHIALFIIYCTSSGLIAMSSFSSCSYPSTCGTLFLISIGMERSSSWSSFPSRSLKASWKMNKELQCKYCTYPLLYLLYVHENEAISQFFY